MVNLLLIIIGILLLIIFMLLAKVYFLRESAREIREAFHDRLTADTNTLIDVSTSDPYMRKLASDINVQLRLLRKEHHRYQQGDLELKEAVTNISHDLRTPLTTISGYLDLAQQEESNENLSRYLSQIRNRTDELKKLTEEMFDYSMVTSSHKISPCITNLVGDLEKSLVSFYALMNQKGIEPKIALPEKAIWKNLDEEALDRIFSNIISNAIKYSDGDLSVVMEEDGKIEFSNNAKDMDSIAVSRLFDRFYTLSTARKSTGLGLAIAKNLVEKMNGKIYSQYKSGRLYIVVQFE